MLLSRSVKLPDPKFPSAVLVATCALIFALACGRDLGSARTTPTPQAIQRQVVLAPAASCEQLSQQLQETAIRQMRLQLDAAKNWGWGPMAAGGDASAGSSPAPAAYSTTNTQVEGVDEADFMKNDGTRIFTLSGQTLFAAKSWPPEELAVVGKLAIEGWPSEMFLDGDQVVVFSSIWTTPAGGGGGASGSPIGGGMPGVCALDGNGCFFGWSATKLTVVDVSTLAAPVVTAELYLPGWSAGSRRIGSSVRLVLGDEVRWPEAMKWWPDYDPELYSDKDKLAAALAQLADANEAVIRQTPLRSWFPAGQRKLADGTLVELDYQCSDFYLSNAPERLGLVTVATVDLSHLELGVSRTSIVGEPGVLYATEDRLTLASRHWWWWAMPGQEDFTYLHQFDLSDPAKARYLASGGVPGHVDNHFSLDEKDGYLRVATSTQTVVDDLANPGWFRFQVGSRLSVLGLRADPDPSGAAQGLRLALVGEIPSLEDGERLMAMRFLGDRAFAVTFRTFDPLISLDLTDPAHPKKVGELTVPGFSTYLQPIDETHLLAIGVDLPLDQDGRPDWSKRSLELSLFDVGDLANPKRTAQALVGTAWAYSEAMWDHHAFNWFRPDASQPGLLAIPFSDWLDSSPDRAWWEGFVSDVRLFSVDPSRGITPAGALGLRDVYLQVSDGRWSWWYRPWVRRSVLATDTGGSAYVYAVSDAGLRVAKVGALDRPIATALFEQ